MEALTQLISELSGDTSFITSEAAIDALIDRALGRKFNRALLNRCLAADDAQDGEGEVAGPADPLRYWSHLFAAEEVVEEIDYEDDPEVEEAIEEHEREFPTP
jgi:hypothetical protein